MDRRLQKKLMAQLNVDENYLYKIKGPLDLTFLMKAYGISGFEQYKLPAFTPQKVPGYDRERGIFEQISEHDILLHHPYYEFTPVIDFISQAANDKNVLAIKQTLYRVSGNSPIVASLARAAENGKQVTVLVELKARFDEENNIGWAKMLEKAGCHVIYGLVGLKTHSKIALVVRKEEDGIKRYVHLGTGNYNDVTAKLYTDMGLLTCNDAIGEDATAVFNMLSGYSEPPAWNKLMVAPIWLKDRFLMLINREAENAKKGKEARIVAKMNSLCDPAIIEALYKASAAGVKIDLIIRGICCLKTGIPGISENIHVRSIVGNFLEHSRIFYFYNDGFEDVYMGSADWMPRNLDKRVEITFPVEDEGLKEEVIAILKLQLEDTLKAHILQPNGREYAKQDLRGQKKIAAQDEFCRQALESREREKKEYKSRIFEPVTSEGRL
jgi:polyphosphate kinase